MHTTENADAARSRAAYALLVAAFGMLTASTTVFEINFPNFLRDSYKIGEWMRGFLEFPRESQGFAVVFYVVLLSSFTERHLFSLAATLSAVGLFGLALLQPQALADGAAGIIPGLPMILCVMVHSAGFHLGAMMQRCIILDQGKLAQAGTRLGNVGFWTTLAGLLASGLVAGLSWSVGLTYVSFFTLAGCLSVLAVITTLLAMRGMPSIRPARRRFLIKRKFFRYYALCALFGVRKQVFVTFALWVLVTVYDQPMLTVAKLWIATSMANLVAQPWIGRLIDRFGPRRTLTVDALFLVLVCLFYGYSAHLFAPAIALWVVSVVYVLDHILFFVGAARSVHVGAIADDQNEVSTTLSMGMTIDHIFSMSVPFVGGLIWRHFGYESVFLMAGGVALLTAWTAFGLPPSERREAEEANGSHDRGCESK